ncbi:hypothetical protein F4819DRAFT_491797 [Hypoxylon fuscum]|nr:hypothetical protein F4819DRAFT_491797 [Hypoxylon fuscum]
MQRSFIYKTLLFLATFVRADDGCKLNYFETDTFPGLSVPCDEFFVYLIDVAGPFRMFLVQGANTTHQVSTQSTMYNCSMSTNKTSMSLKVPDDWTIRPTVLNWGGICDETWANVSISYGKSNSTHTVSVPKDSPFWNYLVPYPTQVGECTNPKGKGVVDAPGGRICRLARADWP